MATGSDLWSRRSGGGIGRGREGANQAERLAPGRKVTSGTLPRDRAVKHRGLQKRKAEPAGTALTTQRGATAKQADSITAQKLAEIGTAIRSASGRVRSVGKGGVRLSFADTVPWFNSYASQVTRRRLQQHLAPVTKLI
ncbi:hypothetical protein NDU88_004395 [Pleurodeles waltl]|uniref:Uncharacterized protein n=1 Tax=Pleurodeles waltl TaxID=8319 RepID=A0AAV7WVP5_PLEWA|nr:hypothetical protein NDU88_004395 [Pleurodeles waltl]